MLLSARGHHNLKCLATIIERRMFSCRPESKLRAKRGGQRRVSRFFREPALSAMGFLAELSLTINRLLRFACNDEGSGGLRMIGSEGLRTMGRMSEQSIKTAVDALLCARKLGG